ncbi:putative amino acid transporter [Fonsecaea pedrosoi]|nr:putative amino acid transporter [Fonsecaea pedrosoi]
MNLKQSWLPGMNMVGAIWTIAGGVAWAIVFGVMAPKHDAKFIFTKFINNSGYTSAGWVFIMSFYSPMYGLYGTDGMMHLVCAPFCGGGEEWYADMDDTQVEEMRNASRDAPVGSIFPEGYLCYRNANTGSARDGLVNDFLQHHQLARRALDALDGWQLGRPYMNWWMDICNSVYGGGVFCALVMMGLNFFIIVGTNNAGSRLAWSMARDKAFPYSDYFAHVSQRFHIPLRAMIAILVVDLVIGLIVLGSDLAFQSIISGGGVTLQIGYVTPVIVVLVRGRKILPPRPHFDLGRWGYPINIVSVCWSLLIIVMYLCPLYVPVTIPTIDYMNWSCLIVGATILFPGIYWVWRARFRYIRDGNSVLEDNLVWIDGVAVAGADALSGRGRGAKES